MKQKTESFKRSTEQIWKDVLGFRADYYRFDKVLNTLYEVRNLEDLPKEKMSVKTANFLSVYLSEKNLHSDIKNYKPDDNSNNS